MSLRVWLPLNGTLDNKGLDNVTVTNSGATVDNNGKIGKCYSFDGNDDYISLNGSCLYNIIKGGSQPFSISFWVYQADSTRAIIFGDYSLAGGIGFNIELTTSHVIRFYWNGSPDLSIGQLNVGTTTWNHVALVYDTTHLYGYLNGNLVYTYTGTLTVKNKTSGSYYLGRDNRTGSTALNGKLNDVRIYDHCLSPMEVKQISQGLILHYPLNRGGFGQENLITGYDTSFLSYPDGAVTLFNNQMDGGAQEIVSNIGGATKCLHLHSNGGSDRQYGTLSATSGKSYTISCDYYSTSSQAIPFRGELNGGNYSWAGSNAAAYTTPNKWVRLFFSYLNLTSNATIFYFMQCSRNTDCYIKNLKIEEGSIATPWCPNSSDALAATLGLNDNVEYDTSGYGNNGTKVGITYSSDTPKYNVSTVFDENADTISVGPCYSVGQTIDTMSCAIWFKTNTLNSTAPNLVSLGENSFFRFRLASATSAWYYIRVAGQARGKTFSCKTLTDNVWHHIAIVFNKGYVYSYIDGELVDTENQTSIGTYLTCGATDGYWHLAGYGITSEAFKGNESDFRIYATALSAADVKSLYNNSAYIDNQGNIYGAVYEEV